MLVSDSSARAMLPQRTVSAGVEETIVWRRAVIALALGWIVTLSGFRETVVSMIRVWYGSSTYSYGFLIIPIFAVLIWRLRYKLQAISPTVSVTGLVSYCASVLLWLGGNVADVQIIQQVALVAMLDSLIWAMLGTSVATVLRFPMVFLCFAVPFGDGLVPILQHWTATVVVAALRLSGIPAFQDGFVLLTPNGSWQVAEACSGIRYLIASIVMGTLVAGIVYKSWKRRIIFLLFSMLLPIVANVVRAYGIVVLAYLTGNAIATGIDHVIYGFVFFSLITTVLMIAAIRWYEPRTYSGEMGARYSSSPPPSSTILVANLICVIVAVASALVVSQFLWSRVPAPPDAAVFAAPAGWTSVSELDSEWAPEPKMLQQRAIESFSSGTNQVSTCFGWYSGVPRGVELINANNLVGDSGVWTVLGGGARRVVIQGRPAVVAEHEIKRGPDHRLVWQWYSVGTELTSSPYRLRLIEAGNRLLGRPQSAVLYAVSAPYQSDSSEASSVLSSFLK